MPACLPPHSPWSDAAQVVSAFFAGRGPKQTDEMRERFCKPLDKLIKIGLRFARYSYKLSINSLHRKIREPLGLAGSARSYRSSLRNSRSTSRLQPIGRARV